MSELKDVATQLLNLYKFPEEMDRYDHIYIYGAGMVGGFVYDYLKNHSQEDKVVCFFTSEPQDVSICGIPIKKIEREEISPNSIVLLAAKRGIRKEMLANCETLGIIYTKEIDVLDDRDYEYYSAIPEVAYPIELREWYKSITGMELNLDDPRNFNEKINWLKLYDKDPRKAKLADKYLVRDYVKEIIGEEYLTPLICVWSRFEDIDFESLPNRFALKCNHGCGWNIIVKDKSILDTEKASKSIKKWMDTSYAFLSGFEMHYNDIKPMIVVEQYIEGMNNNLFDYKVHCFGGEPTFIQVIGDRDLDKHTGMQSLYDMEWNELEWCFDDYPKYEHALPKPDHLEEMYLIAKRLSEGFRYVRVDLYICDRLLFGEMTFSPGSGIYVYKKYFSEKENVMLGKLIDI